MGDTTIIISYAVVVAKWYAGISRATNEIRVNKSMYNYKNVKKMQKYFLIKTLMWKRLYLLV
jgi:hypothetical protein